MPLWRWWDEFPEEHEPPRPTGCLASWLDAFIRWEEQAEARGEVKPLKPRTLAVIRATLQANLLYIRKLEAELAACREADENTYPRSAIVFPHLVSP